MKHLQTFLGSCLVILSLSALPSVQAAQPTNINYSGKGNGYRLYTVRCSDGKKRMITSWRKKKSDKWCLGKGKKSRCTRSQLNAAKKACR